jgi:hypothetical protein
VDASLLYHLIQLLCYFMLNDVEQILIVTFLLEELVNLLYSFSQFFCQFYFLFVLGAVVMVFVDDSEDLEGVVLLFEVGGMGVVELLDALGEVVGVEFY